MIIFHEGNGQTGIHMTLQECEKMQHLTFYGPRR